MAGIELKRKLIPYFVDLLENRDATSLTEVSRITKISYPIVLTQFSAYLSSRKPKPIQEPVQVIKAVFLMPDGMIDTYGGDNKRIAELCGAYTKTLEKNIRARADENTRWNGFN